MNRMIFGTAAAALAAGVAFAPAAHADDTVVVPQAQPAPQPAAQPPVVVTQPQPVQPAVEPPARATVGAEATRQEYAGPNTTLIGTGILVFGVSYGTSAIIAGTSDHPGDSHLYVPIAGPWMDLADRGSCPAGYNCDNETTNKVLLVADGIFQGIGVLSIIGGFLSPETHEVATVAKREPAKPTIHVSPAHLGYAGYGLAAFGTF